MRPKLHFHLCHEKPLEGNHWSDIRVPHTNPRKQPDPDEKYFQLISDPSHILQGDACIDVYTELSTQITHGKGQYQSGIKHRCGYRLEKQATRGAGGIVCKYMRGAEVFLIYMTLFK